MLVIAQAFQTPFPALALVVLSKWRIIAVRPRFWWANIQANLVDLTVGIGVVGLMYLPTSVFYFRVALAILYAIWLVVIKPMSKRWQVAMQSLIAIFRRRNCADGGVVRVASFCSCYSDVLDRL